MHLGNASRPAQINFHFCFLVMLYTCSWLLWQPKQYVGLLETNNNNPHHWQYTSRWVQFAEGSSPRLAQKSWNPRTQHPSEPVKASAYQGVYFQQPRQLGTMTPWKSVNSTPIILRNKLFIKLEHDYQNDYLFYLFICPSEYHNILLVTHICLTLWPPFPTGTTMTTRPHITIDISILKDCKSAGTDSCYHIMHMFVHNFKAYKWDWLFFSKHCLTLFPNGKQIPDFYFAWFINIVNINFVYKYRNS